MTTPLPPDAPTPTIPARQPIPSAASRPREEPWRVGLAGLAAALAAAAFVQVLVAQETALTRGLWAAGMAALIAAQVRRPARADLAAWPLLLILAAAAWMRLFRLGEVPDQFHGDMASWGLAAREYLDGVRQNLFTTLWADIPALVFWQTSLAMRAFGDNLYGLSMHSAIHGVLSVLGTYLLANELFDRRVGLLSAGLLALSYAHIHFSRVAGSIAPLTTAAFTFYFLARGLRTGSRLCLVLSGLALGVGLQDYFNVRIVPLLVLLFLGWTAWRQPDLWRLRRKDLAWLGLGFFVAIAPFLGFALRSPAQLMGRGSVVTLFNPTVMAHLQAKYGVDTAAAVWLENLKRTLLMFSVYGDTSGHSPLGNVPLVDPATAALLLLGVAMALRWIGQPRFALLVAWLGGVMLLGGVVTNDPPFWPHLTILLIPVAILAATAVDRIWQAVADAFGETGDHIAATLIVGGLIYLGIQNFAFYVEQTRNTATPLVHFARYVAQADPRYRILLVPEPWRAEDREIAFMSRGRQVLEITAEELLAVDPTALQGAIVALTPNYADLLPALRLRLPSAQLREHRTGAGEPAFSTLTVEQEKALGTAEPLPEGAYRFFGNTASTVWEVDVDTVTVEGGKLTVRISPVFGYGAVYDYVRLVAEDGREVRVEAESAATQGDPQYADREGMDGHWWLQRFEPFSGGAGLVAQPRERVPPLTTEIAAADGRYRLLIGSFTGDPANGVFALEVQIVR
ncbi:MAG: glycosyltransferase family 39 protein [Caldilineales bacterium]|nr:glycosyltransferase family 39 protein [Caldilineales bacterium]MDW8318159.1 glycosyltransferase family 39 protein [Anaerolineae bacterium]